MLIPAVLAAHFTAVLLVHADFSNSSFKDLADIVAELRRTHPLIDRMKDERVELHSRLTNLTILVDKTLQDPESGHDDPEEDKKIRDKLKSAALYIKQLDDDSEKMIAYGRNLSSWLNRVTAA